MPTRRLLPLILLLLLVLPGCFRQAGEAYEPSTDTAGQTVPTVEGAATSEGVQPVSPTTDSNPPLTIISPPASTPTDEAASSQGGGNETPQDVQPTVDTGRLATSTETPVFLTPGSDLPITEVAPTFAPNVTPTNTPSGLITPTALGDGPTGDGCTYTVQPNNTLFSIARNNNITLDQLREANTDLVGDLIQIGQILNIPGCGQGFDAAGNPVQPTAVGGSVNDSGQTIHVVQSGDTLVRIARQYGVTVQDIVNANNLANPNLLAVGQSLIIPTTPTP